MIISARIDVLKIDKSKLYKGAKGTYLDITLLENRNGPDQYGNDYMIVQDLGKDARAKGEKGAILGNAKNRGGDASPAPKAQHANPAPEGDVEF